MTLHLVMAAIFAAGFGIAGFLAQGRSNIAIIPVVWSAARCSTPIAILVALYARIAHLDRSIPFAILAVLLAAAFGAATEALSKREDRPGLPTSTALFATGTLGALALALTFALEKGWLTIALALMSLGTAWISMQRPIPFLRWLAAIFAGIVVCAIGYDPRIVGDAVGTTPIFNWLLWGYGLPAASFWAASLFLRRRGDDAPLRMVEAAAILFTALLAFMEIRHFVNAAMSSPHRRCSNSRCRSASRSPWRSGWSGCGCAAAASCTMSARSCSPRSPGSSACSASCILENPLLWRIDVGGACSTCCCSATRCRRC